MGSGPRMRSRDEKKSSKSQAVTTTTTLVIRSLKATCALATFTLVVVLPLAMCWEVRGGRRLGHGILRNLNVVSNPPKERASKQIRIANPTKLGTIKTYAEEDPWADKTTTSEDDPFQEKTREVLPDGAVLENMEMPKFDDENQEMQFQEEFDAAFQKASWQETRRREEQKMRVRRKIIEDKLRTLEKIEEEEAKQAEDRNKTISSLNSTGAIDHVLKIGENGDPFRMFLLPPPTKSKGWSVSDKDIIRSFRRLSILVHPDKQKNNPVMYKKATEAFKILRTAQGKLLEFSKNAVKIEPQQQEQEIIRDKKQVLEELARRVDQYEMDQTRNEKNMVFVNEDGAKVVAGEQLQNANVTQDPTWRNAQKVAKSERFRDMMGDDDAALLQEIQRNRADNHAADIHDDSDGNNPPCCDDNNPGDGGDGRRRVGEHGEEVQPTDAASVGSVKTEQPHNSPTAAAVVDDDENTALGHADTVTGENSNMEQEKEEGEEGEGYWVEYVPEGGGNSTYKYMKGRPPEDAEFGYAYVDTDEMEAGKEASKNLVSEGGGELDDLLNDYDDSVVEGRHHRSREKKHHGSRNLFSKFDEEGKYSRKRDALFRKAGVVPGGGIEIEGEDE